MMLLINNRFFAILAILGWTLTASHAEAGYGDSTSPSFSGPNNALILELFNAYRLNGTSCNGSDQNPVTALEWDEQLFVAAQMYSDAIYENRSDQSYIQRGRFDLAGALKQVGYEFTSLYQGFLSGSGGFTAEQYTELTMNNPRTCKELMNPDFLHVAVARTDIYHVMLLAAPKIPHYWNTDSINTGLLVELVNKNRSNGARCGSEYFPPAGPVSWNDELRAAAQIHSNDMNTNSIFSHTGSDRSSLADRVNRIGYKYSTIGENIAMGETQTEELVVEGWMNSPGHCRNIMQGRFTEMGVARSGIYWTQVFGRPRE
jgi:uncharacterized protein YkwD